MLEEKADQVHAIHDRIVVVGRRVVPTEGRRLGGLRRRREKTLAGAYDVGALDSVGSIRRLFEIATFDVLGLENSIRSLSPSARPTRVGRTGS